MFCRILTQLDGNTLVLTANLRLASLLQQQYDQHQSNSGQRVWQTPLILPLNTWLKSLWQQLRSEQLILTDLQEKHLWQSIIQQSEHALLQPKSTAQLAKQAWDMLHLWNLAVTDLDTQHNEAIATFFQWALTLQQINEEQQWLTQAELPTAIANHANLCDAITADTILLVGFDDLPPATHALLTVLKQTHDVRFCEMTTSNSTVERIELENQEAEIKAMAEYARSYIAQHPQQQLGCIIPNLTQCRSLVDRIFTETLAFEKILPGLPANEKRYNISQGQRLAQFAIITSALDIMELLTGRFPIDTISRLLQSPYFSIQANDISAGALLDQWLREWNEPTLPLQSICSLFASLSQHYPQQSLTQRLKQLLAEAQNQHTSRLPSEWAVIFITTLKRCGWPGSRPLSSVEYQLVERFKKLLAECTELNAIVGNLSLFAAKQLIQRMADDILFQPQGSAAPVQILGILEAAGNTFDTVWIMGLHDEAWPPTAKPNPFIPHQVQVAHQMPHADATRELQYTQKIMQRLLNSATQIIVSSPKYQGDQLLRPSHLIQSYPLSNWVDANLSNKPNNYITQLMQHAAMESIQDNQAPAVSSDETIEGGSAVLKQQAICPFRAFATIRLRAYPLAQPELGIPPYIRGLIVHDALDRIWAELKDHATLQQKTTRQLQALIEHQLNHAIEKTKSPAISAINQQLLLLEQQRLSQLLFDWLTHEKSRPPFRVHSQEVRRHIKLGTLSLNVQIDRIDELEDQSYLIIDYKTGLSSIQSWFSERPLEPQLPLYCVFGGQENQQFSAVTFAELRAGRMRFKGLISEAHVTAANTFPELTAINQFKWLNTDNHTTTADWQTTIQHWQQTLLTLSKDFCQGNAAVDPINMTAGCRYCALQPLCRILHHDNN